MGGYHTEKGNIGSETEQAVVWKRRIREQFLQDVEEQMQDG